MSSSLTSSAAAGTRAVTTRRGPNAVQRFNRWWYNGIESFGARVFDEDLGALSFCLGVGLVLLTPLWGPCYAAWWLVASERRPLVRLLFGEDE